MPKWKFWVGGNQNMRAERMIRFLCILTAFLAASFGPLSADEVPPDPVYVKTSNRWVGLFGRHQEYASYSVAGREIEIVDPYHIKLDRNLGMMVTFAEKKEFSGASDLLTAHVEWESQYWRSQDNTVKTTTRNDLSGTRTDLRITEMEIEKAGEKPKTVYVMALASEEGVFVLSICCDQSGAAWAKEIAPSFNLTHRPLDPPEVVRVSKEILAADKDR
jgi:hypothetical protein